MTFGSSTSSSPEIISNMFADFFKSVYEPAVEGCIPEAPINCRIDVINMEFTAINVFEGLAKMDASKGPGPDGIPPKFIKEIAAEICDPLRIIFNTSIKSGIFPALWKISHVTPIFKKGAKSNIENYRSVSIQKSLAKLFDMLVFDKLRPLIAPHLSEKQHGFMARRSAATNLTCYATEVLGAIEKGKEVDAINTDFTKAFDKVSHHILLEKLNHIGLDGPMLRWVGSYLRDRKQYVLFDGEKSKLFNVTSGVPAGTHGGPDLFLVMVNDLVDVIKFSEISLYADDCKIYKQIDGVNDQKLLQADMIKFAGWCQENELMVNPTKCSSITFTRKVTRSSRKYYLGQTELDETLTVKDLGVDIAYNFCFDSHINRITSNAMRVLGFIKRFSGDFKDLRVLKILYCALVRPHLEYCSIVWSPYTEDAIKRIESVQRRFTKFACKRMIPQRDLTYERRCEYLNLETLEQRRKNAGHLFVAGTLSGSIDCSQILSLIKLDVTARDLRATNLLRENLKHKTDYGRNSPVTRMIRNFKEVQELFDFNLTRDQFRSCLKN